MPYFKGVHFDQAFHTEEDVIKHNEANAPAVAEEPVLVQAVPVEPAVEVPASDPAPAPPAEDPDLAVPVDRETPFVGSPPVLDAESDPFPSFEPEKEPETQPEEVEEPVDGKTTVVEGDVPPGETKDETPDAKKKAAKKSSARGK